MSTESTETKSNAVDRLRALLTEEGLTQAVASTRGRKPAQLPALTGPGGRPLSRYATEKAIGLRRENGALKLRKLTARHYKIIGMHLEGKSLEQIAAECHVTFSTISRVLNDPLSQNLIQKVYHHREAEIHALAGPALDATRAAITSGDVGTRLRGVDRWVKIRQAMVDKEQGRESAEDVIARMLASATVNGDVNIQINNGSQK